MDMDSSQFAPALKDRSPYKLWIKDNVRFSDLDALNHVSSVRINEFFASARTTLFKQAIPGWPTSPHVPVLRLNIISHEAEIGFPQALDIGLCIEKFGTTSVTLVMGLFESDKCFALCRNIFVFIDSATRQKTSPTDTIKQNFLKISE
jgi:acyl-CoA thioesterase FadM